MFKALIKFIYAHCTNLIDKIAHKEDGQALPIALAVLALGTMVIGPFLSHAGTTLRSSGQYQQLINENYACEAGVEQAIWALTYGDLTDQFSKAGSSLSYELRETVNSLPVAITITFTKSKDTKSDNKPAENSGKGKGQQKDKKNDKTGVINTYIIASSAGNTMISSTVNIENDLISVINWDIGP